MQPLWLCSTPRPKRLFVTVNVFTREAGRTGPPAERRRVSPYGCASGAAAGAGCRVSVAQSGRRRRFGETAPGGRLIYAVLPSQGLQWRRGWHWRAASFGAHHSSTGAYRRRSALRSGASLFARRVLVFHISGGTTELLFVQRNVCRVPGGRQHRPLCRPGGGPHRRKTGLCVPGRGGLSILASECSEEIKPKGKRKRCGLQLFRIGKPVRRTAGTWRSPGLRCEILPECRGPDGTSNDLCRTGTVSRRAGGMRGRRDEQRYHTRLCTADAAGYLFRTGPVFQRQRHRRGRSGGKGGSGMANVITVTALNRYVKTLLERDSVLTDVALRGEISIYEPL